jgi:uncharacterized membrane protein YhaH (DUF805 family)
MNLWKSSRFWIYYVIYLIVSGVVFSIPGAFFLDDGAGPAQTGIVLALQFILMFLAPYTLARRDVLEADRKESRGFPVIFKDNPRS